MSQKQVRIVEMLATLQRYYNKTLDIDTNKLYVAALDLYSEEDLEYLFNRVLTYCKFFPRIAEFTEIMSERKKHETMEVKHQAYCAYDQAVSVMRKIGRYQTPVFDDQIISSVIQLRFNGWVAFSNIELNEWTRKSFIDGYQEISRLKGFRHNQLSGLHQRKLSSSRAKQIGELLDNEIDNSN